MIVISMFFMFRKFIFVLFFMNIENIEITIIKNSTKINFLEHKEHRNYNYKEQYKNNLPGT
jgi:hypothetical protein